ncbi:hypothetical protein ACHAXA_010641 [Cyclostephanos tholiformis]|uniref:Kinesin motor domain-containing protein n=1 Tax=Cyclostephanos tholiformis TaxID=382380 RepID=A0ABD3R566_9STRA
MSALLISRHSCPTENNKVWRVLQKYNSITQCTPSGKPLPERIEYRTFFSYDKAFDESSSTRQVYEQTSRGIVESVAAGCNGTIFAYGHTSSGKTFTMHGSETLQDGISSGGGDCVLNKGGIIRMAASDIFNHIEKDLERIFLVRVSFIEIYNEEVRDLLVTDDSENNAILKIREDKDRGVLVNSNESIVTSMDSLLSVLFAGEKNRTFAATAMNERSSRSHTIFRITVESRLKGAMTDGEDGMKEDSDDDDLQRDNAIDESGAVRISTLNLVDLAGSESVCHTGATGDRQKEGGMINQSLFSLSRIIVCLGQNATHVNFRDSKLTRILQPSLSGNARMAVICCATPSELYLEETRSTLQFTSRAKLVKTRAQVNEIMDDRSLLKKRQRLLNHERDSMEQMKALKEKFANTEYANRRAEDDLKRMNKLILKRGVLGKITASGSAGKQSRYSSLFVYKDDDETIQAGAVESSLSNSAKGIHRRCYDGGMNHTENSDPTMHGSETLRDGISSGGGRPGESNWREGKLKNNDKRRGDQNNHWTTTMSDPSSSAVAAPPNSGGGVSSHSSSSKSPSKTSSLHLPLYKENTTDSPNRSLDDGLSTTPTKLEPTVDKGATTTTMTTTTTSPPATLSPTPYWKVLEDRGDWNRASPQKTRSAAKSPALPAYGEEAGKKGELDDDDDDDDEDEEEEEEEGDANHATLLLNLTPKTPDHRMQSQSARNAQRRLDADHKIEKLRQEKIYRLSKSLMSRGLGGTGGATAVVGRRTWKRASRDAVGDRSGTDRATEGYADDLTAPYYAAAAPAAVATGPSDEDLRRIVQESHAGHDLSRIEGFDARIATLERDVAHCSKMYKVATVVREGSEVELHVVCAEQRGTIEGYKRQVQRLEAERNGAEGRYKADLEVFDRERREMVAELAKAREAHAADMKRSMDEVASRTHDRYAERYDAIRAELASARSEIEEANRRNELEAENGAAHEGLICRIAELERAKSELTLLLEAEKHDNNANRATIAVLQTNMSGHVATISRQEGSILRLEEEVRSITKILDDANRKLEGTQSLRSRDASEQEFRREMGELEGKLVTMEGEMVDLQHKLREKDEAYQAVRSELDAMNFRLRDATGSIEEAEAKAANMKLKVQQLSKEVRTLEENLRINDEYCEQFISIERRLIEEKHMLNQICANLRNRIIQLSGNIRVFVRVRPFVESERRLTSEVQQPGKYDRTVGGSNSRPMSCASMGPNSGRPPSRESGEDANDECCPFHFPSITDRNARPSSSITGGIGAKSSSDYTSSNNLTKQVIELNELYKDRGGLKERRKKWSYGFDRVFSPVNGQDDVWEAAEPLVQSCIDGYHVCMFAYGQTGSGKTHTMIGVAGDRGLIPRAVKMLFEAKREIERSGLEFVNISVELLEIYNEEVRDLLDDGQLIKLKLRVNEAVGNVKVNAQDEREVDGILKMAQERRCVKATKVNAESSRSHLLFTIHFNGLSNDDASAIRRSGSLHIIDLAGSERLNKSGSHGALLTEAKHINCSLLALASVIEKLQAKEKHIPYRDSKLTYLLQNFLGGDSKTLAIVCCSPHKDHFNESLNSLRFAEKVSRVELKKVNTVDV